MFPPGLLGQPCWEPACPYLSASIAGNTDVVLTQRDENPLGCAHGQGIGGRRAGGFAALELDPLRMEERKLEA